MMVYSIGRHTMFFVIWGFGNFSNTIARKIHTDWDCIYQGPLVSIQTKYAYIVYGRQIFDSLSQFIR